jgi:subtilisin-like proprotein convertase family protein
MCRKLIYLGSFVLLLLVITAATHAQVDNLVLNPSFEEDEAILDDPAWSQWVTWNPPEGAGSIAAIVDMDSFDGAKSLLISSIGAEGWHFIVLYMPIPTEVGESYTASFWAKATQPRPLGVQFKATDNSDSWGYTDFELTAEWAEYSLTAVALNAETKLEFFCAGSEVPLWLDSVSVMENTPAKDPVPADGAVRVSSEPLLNTYSSDDVPLNIPDRGMVESTVYSSLDIPDSFTITDLNVQVNITMPGNNADLNVFLISPDGTRVELFTDVGVMSMDDFKNTVLDDEASISVVDGRGRFEGTYRPEGKLSKFDGKNARGTWKLEITDDWASNVGTLNSWKLIIESPNILSWTPADRIASQDVYISKNFDEVNDSAEAAYQGNFAVDVSTVEIILEVGQQYFWRVDSVDADGALIAAGDVWSFWTTPEPIFVNPDSDLAAANELAIPGGIIEFAPGTYNITSQIIVKEGVTYLGAGPELTIIDGGGATRAFAALGDLFYNEDSENANDSGPKGWVIEGMTIQNCVADTNNRFSYTSAAYNLKANFAELDADASGGLNPDESDGQVGGIRLAGPDGTEGTEDDDLHRFAHIDTDGSGELSEAELDVQLLLQEDEFGGQNGDGGAITILNQSVGTIQNCEFLNNHTPAEGDGDDGGAISISGLSIITINDCLFDGNYAVSPDSVAVEGSDGDGGHIKVQGNSASAITPGTTLIANRCAFLNGNASDDGGAIQSAAVGSVVRLDSCWFEGNTSWDNGNVCQFSNNTQHEVTVTNCIFVKNVTKADNSPDRMIETNRNSKFINCTFVGNNQEDQDLIYNNANTADTDGDGVDDETADVTQVMNCIFLNNVVGNGDHVLGSRNDNFSIAAKNCLFFGNTLQNGDPAENTQRQAEETGSITEDPLLDADLVPSKGSPAIDASDPDTATAADIVGMPAFGIRDLGAYESEFEPPPTIAWVSYHAADDEPHADAAAVGFTQAPDIGYTNLLKANGYKVVRVLTSQTPDVEFLNTMDLVIISRTASSGHYGGSGATAWNSVTAPMINLNGYTLRNSRLGFTDGGDMPDTTGDIRLAVTDPTHPIFAGIALTDGVMDNLYAAGAVPLPTDGTPSRGISINNNTPDNDGIVLATIAEVSADTGPVGGMVIAEWPAGAIMENSSGSPDDVLGGPRLVFLTGSREPDGVTGGQAAALYDLYPDGEKMFLNAVEYMLQ